MSPDIVINEVGGTLSRAHLKMNKAKIRVMPASKRQLICGLIVNKRLSLTKGLKRKLMSDVAYGRINSVSVDGWVANLRSFDSIFGNKLKIYATRKGLYDQRAM